MFCKNDCGIFLDTVTESLRTPQLLVNESQKDCILSTFLRLFFDDPNFSTPKFSSSSVLVQFTMRNKNFPHNHEHRKILAQSIVMFPNLFLVSQHHFFFPNLGGYRRRNQLRPAYFALITMKFVARSGNYFECFITYLIVDFFFTKTVETAKLASSNYKPC